MFYCQDSRRDVRGLHVIASEGQTWELTVSDHEALGG